MSKKKKRRKRKSFTYANWRAKMNNVDRQYIDFEIIGYDPHPHIKGEVAV